MSDETELDRALRIVAEHGYEVCRPTTIATLRRALDDMIISIDLEWGCDNRSLAFTNRLNRARAALQGNSTEKEKTSG